MIIQRIIPGLESYFGFNGQEEIIFSEPKEIIEFYETRGYEFLADWNSGKLLVKSSSEEPYIPDRIRLPSGRIFDESELMVALTKEIPSSIGRKELEDAFYFFNALTHTEMETDRYDGARSFIDEKDEADATRKYSARPFFRQEIEAHPSVFDASVTDQDLDDALIEGLSKRIR